MRSAMEVMEQHYVGSIEAGSPCYQYLLDHPASKWPASRGREKHLTRYELTRWLSANNITGGFAYGPELDNTIFYPEYDRPGRLNKSKMRRKPSKRGQSAPKGKATGSHSNARVQKPKKKTVRKKRQKSSQHRTTAPQNSGPHTLPTDTTVTRALRPRDECRRSTSGRVPQVPKPYGV